MSDDKMGGGADRGQGENRGSDSSSGLEHRESGKALEGGRGGVILPIQTAPMDITNQVGGLPPARDASSGGPAPSGSGSGEE